MNQAPLCIGERPVATWSIGSQGPLDGLFPRCFQNKKAWRQVKCDVKVALSGRPALVVWSN